MVKTEDIIRIARSWLGTPYHHQASLKGVGADCLGLVRGVYEELYGTKVSVTIDYSRDWGECNGREDMVTAAYKYLEPVPIENVSPGNVILIRWREGSVAKHSMIMTSYESAIHAYDRSPVAEIRLNKWWRNKIAYCFAFPQEVK